MKISFRYILSLSFLIILICQAGTAFGQMSKTLVYEDATLETVWQDTIPDNWSGIDLTGNNAKTAGAVDKSGNFPFWIPIVAVGAGVGAYFLLRDNEDDPAFELMDDQITGNCTGTTSLDPTLNDIGTGLMVANVNSPPEADVTINGNTIVISNITSPSNFSFTVMIRDEAGQSGMSTVFVTVSAPQIEAIDDQFQTPEGEELSGNVLTNDIGENLEVTSFTQPNGGTANLGGSGQLSFIPDEGFSGSTTMNYTITGPCGAMSNASVTIVVLADNCMASINVDAIPADCGEENGSATITTSPAGTFDFDWSNGGMGASQSDLAPGNYSVTITGTEENCREVVEVIIEEDPLNIDISSDATPSNCGSDNGTAEVTVNTPGEFDYEWSTGDNGTRIENLEAGTYQLTITKTGTDCREIVSVVVPEVEAEFEVDLSSTNSTCGMDDGSASAVVSPAGGYDFQWSNGESTASIENLLPGTYDLTVTLSGTDCEKTFSVDVEDTPPQFEAVLNSTEADCGLANGSIDVNVSPSGSYTYAWSNGSTEQDLENIQTGSYMLTIADQLGCELTFSSNVLENPASYIDNISAVEGNCIGEGTDIMVTTSTLGSGPMEIRVSGPDGVNVVQDTPGVTSLSNFFTLLPGDYTVEVSDVNIGNGCSEVRNLTIADNSVFEVNDDTYQTFVNFPVNGNVFDNDEGPALEITFNTFPNSGILTLNENGLFTYVPPADLPVSVTFDYTATDGCGNVQTATVTINVIDPPCDFIAGFDIEEANCGLPDGSIQVLVDPPGNYTFQWSDDSTGANRDNLLAGDYTVTITDTDNGCSAEFTVPIDDLPPSHISNVTVAQPECLAPGTILFDVNTEGPGQLVMDYFGPSDTGQVSIQEGEIILDKFVPIEPGDYKVRVYDVLAGPACSDSFEVTILAPIVPVIQVGNIVQPTGPMAINGSITINIVTETVIPYFISVNGMPMGATAQNSFTLDNLNANTYVIQVSDGEGCPSNIIEVVLEPQMPSPISVEMSMTNIGPPTPVGSVEHPPIENPNKAYVGLAFRWENKIGKIPSVTRVGIVQDAAFPGVNDQQTGQNAQTGPPRSSTYFYFDQLFRGVDLDLKGLNFELLGGFGAGFTTGSSGDIFPQWVIEAGMNYPISSKFTTFFNARISGQDYIGRPAISGGIRCNLGSGGTPSPPGQPGVNASLPGIGNIKNLTGDD